jgi:hypothetical protein
MRLAESRATFRGDTVEVDDTLDARSIDPERLP